MDLVLHERIKAGDFLSPVPLPLPYLPPPPPVAQSNLDNKISPSVLLIIVILAIIFFISGLLHLLVRYLLRPSNRDPEDMDNVTALQGRLQQLFHLHDAGVDQSFIDTLPVFLYKAIIGLKDPFDCAVCLCEFECDDKLRLLPKCSHAFHMECIDTWLLSHSTCPLCRGSLLPDFSPSNSCSPLVLVLESGSESSREIAPDRGEPGSHSHLGFLGEDDFRPSSNDASLKQGAAVEKEEVAVPVLENSEAKVVPVRLGKFRNADANGGEGEGSSSAGGNSNLDQRRCFSMGSYEYVMDEGSVLKVAIKPPKKRPTVKKPGQGLAMSECDCHSRREGFKAFEPSQSVETGGNGGGIASLNRRESFSISKIWLRAKRDRPVSEDCSRRALSFRLPLPRGASDESKMKSSTTSPITVSEFSVSGCEKSGSELDFDAELGSCNNSVGSRVDETPSFARRTLLWIVGRQNRVGNHLSYGSNPGVSVV
ncbi:RING-H2 finger protein ATL13-like [Phoenix dactylifera]|uniref:RING-type E3 ubiquitin transferase n=1 Tax=Phoenix dactylifera TaxID=42345 RepID=A0A8B7BL87_PHODC|nr:RING-H2 finger protein ATL13-like [Phoenix dactylifera]